MEVQIVKFFQGLSSGFADAFFWLVTKMGEETFFLIVLAIVYLCYSDKFALKLTFYYLISVAFNNVVKHICRRPRPYVASSEVKDRLHAGGYSFPSGHTQGYFVLATTTSIEIGSNIKKKSIKTSLISVLGVIGVLVMISRMYWGQHYLSDVIVGMMFGIAVPFFLDFLLRVIPVKIKKIFTIDRIYKILGSVSIVLAIVTILINIFTGNSLDLIYKFSAVFIAMSIGYFINNKKIKYVANQGFMIGILKALIMLVVVVGMYMLSNLVFDINSYMCFVVYLCLGLICTIILPIVFKFIFKKGYNNEKSDN